MARLVVFVTKTQGAVARRWQQVFEYAANLSLNSQILFNDQTDRIDIALDKAIDPAIDECKLQLAFGSRLLVVCSRGLFRCQLKA